MTVYYDDYLNGEVAVDVDSSGVQFSCGRVYFWDESGKEFVIDHAQLIEIV